MTKDVWLSQALKHKDKLIDLISIYHPAVYRDGECSKTVTITARDAEAACGLIRDKIRDETKEAPIGAFKDALELEDIDKIYSLLSAAWFGVPESTSCWKINGFKEAVDLMDDQPEEDENESTQTTAQ